LLAKTSASIAGNRGLHGGGKGNDEIEVAARRIDAPVGRRTEDLEPLDAMLAAQPRYTCAARCARTPVRLAGGVLDQMISK